MSVVRGPWSGSVIRVRDPWGTVSDIDMQMIDTVYGHGDGLRTRFTDTDTDHDFSAISNPSRIGTMDVIHGGASSAF